MRINAGKTYVGHKGNERVSKERHQAGSGFRRLGDNLDRGAEKVFNMYFIKRKDVNFIADTLCVSPRVINREIHEAFIP